MARRISEHTRTSYQRQAQAFVTWASSHRRSIGNVAPNAIFDALMDYIIWKVAEKPHTRIGTIRQLVSAVTFVLDLPSVASYPAVKNFLAGLRHTQAAPVKFKKPLRFRWITEWAQLYSTR